MKKLAGALILLFLVMAMTTGCPEQKCPGGSCSEEHSPK